MAQVDSDPQSGADTSRELLQVDELLPKLEKLLRSVGDEAVVEQGVEIIEQLRKLDAQKETLIECKNLIISRLDTKLRERRQTSKAQIEPADDATIRRLLLKHNFIHTLRTFDDETALLMRAAMSHRYRGLVTDEIAMRRWEPPLSMPTLPPSSFRHFEREPWLRDEGRPSAPVDSTALDDLDEASELAITIRDKCKILTSATQSPDALRHTRVLHARSLPLSGTYMHSLVPLESRDAEREALLALEALMPEYRRASSDGLKVALGVAACRNDGAWRAMITRCRVAHGPQYLRAEDGYVLGSTRVLVAGWADRDHEDSPNGLSSELAKRLTGKLHELLEQRLPPGATALVDALMGRSDQKDSDEDGPTGGEGAAAALYTRRLRATAVEDVERGLNDGMNEGLAGGARGSRPRTKPLNVGPIRILYSVLQQVQK